MDKSDWKLEAVHEHFDVFEKLFEPCSSFSVMELRMIIDQVYVIINKQLRKKNSDKVASVRAVSSKLIKAIPEQENIIRLSYVVVVTNEVVGGQLCKIPVFRVLVAENQHTFVDISGTVYKSWNAFMENNDLPACEFCYPVNGCYDVGGKLKIDFARSPASVMRRNTYWFAGGVVVGCIVVAASLYFKIAPMVSNFVTKLIPLVEELLPKIAIDVLKHMQEFGILAEHFRAGDKSIIELSSSMFKLLSRFYSTFKTEISCMWEMTKKSMSSAYNYLFRLFAKYFKRASNESQHSFFATVVKVDEEMSRATKETGARLSEMNRSFTSSENPVTTLSTVKVLSINQQIFANCKKESIFHEKVMNHKEEHDNYSQSQPFYTTTETLLTKSTIIADKLKKETLSDVKDIFEALSCIVKDEYNNKIDNYINGVNAAKAAADNHEIDLSVYNKSLGIIRDPKDHYMNEALQSIQQLRLVHRLMEKIKQFQMDTKITLIPICQKPEDEVVGLYKAIGVRGQGKFNAQRLLTALKELIDLEEDTLVVNETNSIIHIQSEEMTIFAYQEINDENTSVGIVNVNRI